jgi:hypothetical protein
LFPARRAHSTSSATSPHMQAAAGPMARRPIPFLHGVLRALLVSPGELALVVPHPVCRHRCGVLAGVVGSPGRQAGDAAEDRWHSLCRLHHWVRLCAAVAWRIECHCCFSQSWCDALSSPLPTIATATCLAPTDTQRALGRPMWWYVRPTRYPLHLSHRFTSPRSVRCADRSPRVLSSRLLAAVVDWAGWCGRCACLP